MIHRWGSDKVRALFISLFAGALALTYGAVAAGEFPGRTISIIVPFAAGGGNDVQARLVAKGLSERLGTPGIRDKEKG